MLRKSNIIIYTTELCDMYIYYSSEHRRKVNFTCRKRLTYNCNSRSQVPVLELIPKFKVKPAGMTVDFPFSATSFSSTI